MLEVETPRSRVAIIRTSDRTTFKRCRRKWGITSHLQHNLTEAESAEYLWLGSGGHYAFEDYYGYNYYGHPVKAFQAYYEANKRLAAAPGTKFRLPISHAEQATLLEQILEYYLVWVQGRDHLKTYWHEGKPQVEVVCTAKLPFTNEYYDEVYYQATFDRVVVIDDELWVLDYKFYQRDWSPNLDFDPQMSAYIWLAQVLYNKPVRGAIVQKHFKELPNPPRILSNGRISADKSQNTTHRLYREALMQMYGSIEKAPLDNVRCLNTLAEQEGWERDGYVNRDRTSRSDEQIAATGEQIMMELPELLNPDIPLYKNETKDCNHDCGYKDICLMIDDNVDWEEALRSMTINRDQGDTSWRTHLPHLRA